MKKNFKKYAYLICGCIDLLGVLLFLCFDKGIEKYLYMGLFAAVGLLQFVLFFRMRADEKDSISQKQDVQPKKVK